MVVLLDGHGGGHQGGHSAEGASVLNLVDEVGLGDVPSEVVDVESGALEHGRADGFSDVVDISLDGSHDDGGFGLSGLSASGEFRSEVVHSLLHSVSGTQDVGQEQFSPLEKDTDLGHGVSEAVDDGGSGHAGVVGLIDSFGDVGYFTGHERVVQFFLFVLESHFFTS